MKFFIIHGSYGNPNENWFPRLKKELEKEGCIVFIPEFPTPENQSLKNWMEIFNDFYLSKIDENTILIGHMRRWDMVSRLIIINLRTW